MRSDGDSVVNDSVYDEEQILKLGKQRASDLGIVIFNCAGHPVVHQYQKLYRLLGEAPEAFAQLPERGGACWYSSGRYDIDTHKCYMIGIQPIVKESRERALLREIYEDERGTYLGQRLFKAMHDLLAEKPE